MKIAVIGSREFNDYSKLKQEIEKLNLTISKVISGGAKGADALGEIWARENGVELTIYQPDWKKYGRSAGVIRNKLIIEDCDVCIAFWNGKSKGTKNSIEFCKKLNKTLFLITYKDK